MLKCPFCAFENEDGALFCEQCKSDLSTAEAAKAAPAAQEASGVEGVPLAAVVEDTPVPAGTEPVPLAAVVEPTMPMSALMAEVAAATAPTAAEGTPAPITGNIPADAQPKLVVIRGQKIGAEYPIYPELNFIGRSDEKPVDIDLEDQEPPDRIWTSRQHALVTFENGAITIEDLNSSNGTYVNRNRVYPGQKKQLNPNDVIQIGTVQMKVKV